MHIRPYHHQYSQNTYIDQPAMLSVTFKGDKSQHGKKVRKHFGSGIDKFSKQQHNRKQHKNHYYRLYILTDDIK